MKDRISQIRAMNLAKQQRAIEQQAAATVKRMGTRDPVTGQYEVLGEDGSAVRIGKQIFAANPEPGQIVQAIPSPSGEEISLDSRSTNRKVVDELPQVFQPDPCKGYIRGQVWNCLEKKKKTIILVPILFSKYVVLSGTREFYIGGDRSTPRFLFSIPGDRDILRAYLTAARGERYALVLWRDRLTSTSCPVTNWSLILPAPGEVSLPTTAEGAMTASNCSGNLALTVGGPKSGGGTGYGYFATARSDTIPSGTLNFGDRVRVRFSGTLTLKSTDYSLPGGQALPGSVIRAFADLPGGVSLYVELYPSNGYGTPSPGGYVTRIYAVGASSASPEVYTGTGTPPVEVLTDSVGVPIPGGDLATFDFDVFAEWTYLSAVSTTSRVDIRTATQLLNETNATSGAAFDFELEFTRFTYVKTMDYFRIAGDDYDRRSHVDPYLPTPWENDWRKSLISYATSPPASDNPCYNSKRDDREFNYEGDNFYRLNLTQTIDGQTIEQRLIAATSPMDVTIQKRSGRVNETVCEIATEPEDLTASVSPISVTGPTITIHAVAAVPL